jgi:hypothetical protein
MREREREREGRRERERGCVGVVCVCVWGWVCVREREAPCGYLPITLRITLLDEIKLVQYATSFGSSKKANLGSASSSVRRGIVCGSGPSGSAQATGKGGSFLSAGPGQGHTLQDRARSRDGCRSRWGALAEQGEAGSVTGPVVAAVQMYYKDEGVRLLPDAEAPIVN